MSSPLAVEVGDESWLVGSPDLLHAFFSSVSHRLEPDGWGTRFPALMLHLYQGELAAQYADRALVELAAARRELAEFAPADVVWDIDDLAARPPWGAELHGTAPNLARYFVTVDGNDVFDVLTHGLVRLRARSSGAARIVAGVLSSTAV